MTKVIVGDEISIRAKVTSVGVNGFFCATYDSTDGDIVTQPFHDTDAFVTHHPKPREIKAGSLVRHKDAKDGSDEVLFRHGEQIVLHGYRSLAVWHIDQFVWVGEAEPKKD